MIFKDNSMLDNQSFNRTLTILLKHNIYVQFAETLYLNIKCTSV